MPAAKILAVDPEVHPDNFEYEALISAKFVSENEQDQKQIDELLAELEQLTHEIFVWAMTKSKGHDEASLRVLEQAREDIKREEEAQDVHISKISQFLKTFRNAFSLLLG